ncbi:MAG: hypothetical protein LBL86_01520 [Coriobacteriales bacterium]|jgi:hypothetical protein|nr:hypothetical protein [Coriobacteriales bacterium]
MHDGAPATDKKQDNQHQLLLGHERLSTLYAQVLGSSVFAFSQADQKTMNDEDNKAQAQVSSVLRAFEDIDGAYSSPLPLGGKLQDVFNQVLTTYGSIEKIPDSMSRLRNALAAYEEATRNSYNLHSRSTKASVRLGQAIANAESPSKANGGQQTGAASWAVGYTPEKLPDANTLIGSLQSSGNAISLSLSASNFSTSTTSLRMDNRTSFTVPLGFFALSVSHSSEFDYSTYMHEDSSMQIDMKYPGLTLVAAEPSALVANGATGWYAEDILSELAEKSGKDATGYQLHGDEFSVGGLFGKGGRLSRLRTFVISQYPTVSMTMHKVDVSSVSSHFETHNSARLSLLGLITLGEHSDSYQVSSVTSSAASESVTVTFSPPAISGTTSLEQQVAYVLGGVASYPGIRG